MPCTLNIMSSTTRLDTAVEEARWVVAEAHGALRDLRVAKRELEAVEVRIRQLVEGCLLEEAREAVRAAIASALRERSSAKFAGEFLGSVMAELMESKIVLQDKKSGMTLELDGVRPEFR